MIWKAIIQRIRKAKNEGRKKRTNVPKERVARSGCGCCRSGCVESGTEIALPMVIFVLEDACYKTQEAPLEDEFRTLQKQSISHRTKRISCLMARRPFQGGMGESTFSIGISHLADLLSTDIDWLTVPAAA